MRPAIDLEGLREELRRAQHLRIRTHRDMLRIQAAQAILEDFAREVKELPGGAKQGIYPPDEDKLPAGD